MAEATSQPQSTQALQGERVWRPYPPGWLDRFVAWVESLPLPPWLFYSTVCLALILLQAVLKWSDGVYPVGTFNPVDVAVVLGLAYNTGVLRHYFTRAAGEALDTFRPALRGDGTQAEGLFEDLRYRLTTMPTRLTWLSTAAGWALGTAVFLLSALPAPGGSQNAAAITFSPLKLGTSAIAIGFDYVLFSVAWIVIVNAVAYSVRVLQLIGRIYTQHANVDVFDIGPLYTFSALTSRIMVLGLFSSYAFYFVASQGADPLSVWGLQILSVIAVTMVLSVAGFLLPLLGPHRLLDKQKRALLQENLQQMKAAAAETHRLLGARELSGVSALKDAMDNLVTERNMLEKLQTWPWRSESPRLLASAILLPVVVFLLEEAIIRLMGR